MHAQDNRTSQGMFCRELTQICSQESSPQNTVVNTPSDAKPLIVAMNSWRFWIILSGKYLKTIRLKYFECKESQTKLTLSNMSILVLDCSCDSLKIWALMVADIRTILLHVFSHWYESKDEIHVGRSCGISLKKLDFKEKYRIKNNKWINMD